MINIIIDNKVVNVLPNITVMQACLEQKIDVPRFCYHERLSIAVRVVCV